ncbi:MAG: hypothetical protein KDA75_17775, partial [Planctomycetaceae bacterium]|nr:hypothetical protein [Planctomycetaceae bacterium]
AIPLDHEQAPLWDELNQHLDQHGQADLHLLKDELDRAPWRTSPAGEALQLCLDRTDSAELLTLAHRLGREWLATG